MLYEVITEHLYHGNRQGQVRSDPQIQHDLGQPGIHRRQRQRDQVDAKHRSSETRPARQDLSYNFV